MAVKYPHMLPGEVEIWDRYLAEYGVPAGRIEYDVHLGDGAPVDPAWPAWMAGMVKSLSTHRCDVVIERMGEVVIVEVKKIAGMGALGQLMGYEALWIRDMGTSRSVRLVLVCERLEADMKALFDFYEVEVVEVG